MKVGTSFTIKEISQMYPIHNEIVWGYLKTGIERLVNQEKEPATFFLVQRSGKNDIAYDIAYAAGNIVAKSLSKK